MRHASGMIESIIWMMARIRNGGRHICFRVRYVTERKDRECAVCFTRWKKAFLGALFLPLYLFISLNICSAVCFVCIHMRERYMCSFSPLPELQHESLPAETWDIPRFKRFGTVAANYSLQIGNRLVLRSLGWRRRKLPAVSSSAICKIQVIQTRSWLYSCTMGTILYNFKCRGTMGAFDKIWNIQLCTERGQGGTRVATMYIFRLGMDLQYINEDTPIYYVYRRDAA